MYTFYNLGSTFDNMKLKFILTLSALIFLAINC